MRLPWSRAPRTAPAHEPDAPGPNAPSSRAPSGPSGRAYLGLALLGWGVSILVGVTPHEDPLVGAGLAAFGLALTLSAPRLPEFRGSLSPWLVAVAGLAIAIGVLAFDSATHANLDGPKLLMVLLGLGLAAASPFLARRLPLWRGRSMTVASLVVASLAVLGAPLAAWGLQAITKGAVGTTPVEAFVHFALIGPISLAMRAIGMHPLVQGQTIIYTTPTGPLALEVGAACSGVQAMALFAGILGLFLWIEKPGGRRLALWTAIGLFGVYVANLLRLAMLFVVGYNWGIEALEQFHAQAGWMFFVAWALVFARLARAPRGLSKPPALRTP